MCLRIGKLQFCETASLSPSANSNETQVLEKYPKTMSHLSFDGDRCAQKRKELLFYFSASPTRLVATEKLRLLDAPECPSQLPVFSTLKVAYLHPPPRSLSPGSMPNSSSSSRSDPFLQTSMLLVNPRAAPQGNSLLFDKFSPQKLSPVAADGGTRLPSLAGRPRSRSPGAMDYRLGTRNSSSGGGSSGASAALQPIGASPEAVRESSRPRASGSPSRSARRLDRLSRQVEEEHEKTRDLHFRIQAMMTQMDQKAAPLDGNVGEK